jgi:hypothetical protein
MGATPWDVWLAGKSPGSPMVEKIRFAVLASKLNVNSACR